MSDNLLEKYRKNLEIEEDNLILLEINRKFLINEDDIDNIEELQEECKNKILRYKLWIIELKKKKREYGLITYGGITFDLRDKTLEIGIKSGKDKIKHIDRVKLETTNLDAKTSTAIMLLYCIIAEAKDNNFVIKDTFNDYIKHIKIYILLTGKNKSKAIPTDFDTYISSVNTLLKIFNSGYEIKSKKGNNPRIFQKINTNKSS